MILQAVFYPYQSVVITWRRCDSGFELFMPANGSAGRRSAGEQFDLQHDQVVGFKAARDS